MATYYLLNTTNVRTKKYFSGRKLDDTIDPTTDIAASGGVLWPTTDTTVAAAAALVSARRSARAINEEECDMLMFASASASTLRNSAQPAGANLTDADATIQIGAGTWRKLPVTTLSAGRSLTLGTTGAQAGDQIEITRSDVTANTYAVINGGGGAGTLYTFPVSKAGSAKFQFDGTNWALRSVGLGS